MSMCSTDKGLLTPDNCGLIFIDHQPRMFFGQTQMNWEDLLKNVLLLGKAARIFGLPVILTAVECGDFDGRLAPQLLDLLPDQPFIQRSSMNAWDAQRYVDAVRRKRRRNFLIAALWGAACRVFTALQMLEEGYGVDAVKGASCGADEAGNETALRRVEQAGGVSVTAFQVLLELQRDWARAEHCEEVMAMVNEHCCGHGRSG